MITMAVIKKWVTDTLKANAEFTQLCVDTVGFELNYYRSSPVDRSVEVYPHLTVYGDNKNHNKLGGEFKNTWVIPIVIGIIADDKSVVDGGVDTWTSSDKVEILEFKMVEILSKEANCGINGNFSIRIGEVETMVTEIGEADDIQANIFVKFVEENYI